MATLTNTKIKDTYKSLLKVSDNGNLEAGLQEITDGEGNASGVQLNTGGDLTASGTVAFGSLKDSGENITITKFVDETDGIASNDNDTTIPTSAAVKDYVDTKVTAEDLDFAGDSGTGAVDLDSQTFTIAGTANEIETSASGQTITIGLPSTITANVTGNVSGNLTGTVLTAAQPNITSVGTLSSLAVSGNLTVDTNTLFVDSANNRVGVGTSSPRSILETNGTISINDSQTTLGVGDTLAGLEIYTNENSYLPPSGRANMPVNRILPVVEHSEGDAFGMAFYTAAKDADSVERMRILSSGGITFNGDTAAANALDDYEEGTWTPEIADAGTGGNTATIGTESGKYTKIGNQVFVTALIGNINTSGMTSGNPLFVRGLPYTPSETSYGSVILDGFTFTGNYCVFAVSSLGTYGTISQITSNASDGALLVSAVDDANSDILFSATYIV